MRALFLAAVLLILAEPTALGKVCVSSTACDDGNPCTVDSCLAKLCTNNPLEDGTPCGQDMACRNGNCLAVSAPVEKEEPEQPAAEEENGYAPEEEAGESAQWQLSFELPHDLDLSPYYPYVIAIAFLVILRIVMGWLFKRMNKPSGEKKTEETETERQKKKVMEELKRKLSE
jgi:hypothetical protein